MNNGNADNQGQSIQSDHQDNNHWVNKIAIEHNPEIEQAYIESDVFLKVWHSFSIFDLYWRVWVRRAVHMQVA